jgi:hypothetical protein
VRPKNAHTQITRAECLALIFMVSITVEGLQEVSYPQNHCFLWLTSRPFQTGDMEASRAAAGLEKVTEHVVDESSVVDKRALQAAMEKVREKEILAAKAAAAR